MNNFDFFYMNPFKFEYFKTGYNIVFGEHFIEEMYYIFLT